MTAVGIYPEGTSQKSRRDAVKEGKLKGQHEVKFVHYLGD